MLEYEEKLIITKHQYERLLCAFPTLKTITQTNYYYDTEELLLNSRRITFRIREKGNTLIATVKKHSISDAYCSEETTYPVSDIMGQIKYENQTLRLFGSLVSERRTIICNEGIECTVDKNTYLNKIDYEIEVEYSPDKLQEANCLIRNIRELLNYNVEDTGNGNNLNMIYSEKSKSERFFEEYQKRKEEHTMKCEKDKSRETLLLKEFKECHNRMGTLLYQLTELLSEPDDTVRTYDPDDYLLKEVCGSPAMTVMDTKDTQIQAVKGGNENDGGDRDCS